MAKIVRARDVCVATATSNTTITINNDTLASISK